MIYRLYRYLSWLGYPACLLLLHYRKKCGKEDKQRFAERKGITSLPRPKGPLLYMHAASVGEALSILPFMQAALAQYPTLYILVTTGTVTSAQLLESRLPERAFHQFVPIDSMVSIQRFLRHWQPNLAIWVESEFWPNLIMETRKHCPLILLNARMSSTSYRLWHRCPNLARLMLSQFILSLPQSLQDMERLTTLGAPACEFIGNLKCDAPTLPADSKAMGQLVNQIGDRPVWIASSTHPGEEEQIMATHLTLKEQHPTLLTIIIPRHYERGKELTQLITQGGLQGSLRSKDDVILDTTDIYVADSMGELGLFYRLAMIVFIGGSLIPHGGQNPLEAARLECALIAGPSMENFTAICQDLEQAEALLRVPDQQALTTTLDTLLRNEETQENMAQAALKVTENQSGILSATLTRLAPFIDSMIHKATG